MYCVHIVFPYLITAGSGIQPRCVDRRRNVRLNIFKYIVPLIICLHCIVQYIQIVHFINFIDEICNIGEFERSILYMFCIYNHRHITNGSY